MDIGVIPDGNRRYADSEGVKRVEAYRDARGTMQQITESLQDLSDELDSITFYLLSEENLERGSDELDDLFSLLEENISDMSNFFEDQDLRVNWACTNSKALPSDLRSELEDIENSFNEGDTVVNLLISYSGKNDILQAAKKVSDEEALFSRENFSNKLEVKSDIDFVIRTGDNPDRECLSGFPIWNSSYAEFYHIKKNFPNITSKDVRKAFEHFKDLRRKKGR